MARLQSSGSDLVSAGSAWQYQAIGLESFPSNQFTYGLYQSIGQNGLLESSIVSPESVTPEPPRYDGRFVRDDGADIDQEYPTLSTNRYGIVFLAQHGQHTRYRDNRGAISTTDLDLYELTDDVEEALRLPAAGQN